MWSSATCIILLYMSLKIKTHVYYINFGHNSVQCHNSHENFVVILTATFVPRRISPRTITPAPLVRLSNVRYESDNNTSTLRIAFLRVRARKQTEMKLWKLCEISHRHDHYCIRSVVWRSSSGTIHNYLQFTRLHK